MAQAWHLNTHPGKLAVGQDAMNWGGRAGVRAQPLFRNCPSPRMARRAIKMQGPAIIMLEFKPASSPRTHTKTFLCFFVSHIQSLVDSWAFACIFALLLSFYFPSLRSRLHILNEQALASLIGFFLLSSDSTTLITTR
jgi:hypothetical protein